MFNILSLKDVLATSDLELASMILESTERPHVNERFLGTALMTRGKSPPTPPIIPATEVMCTNLTTPATMFMVTGRIKLQDLSYKDGLILVGKDITSADVTETMKANLDRLATILGYTGDLGGTEGPMWVICQRGNVSGEP